VARKLSQKLRFEVFKRDEFTCQYCGRKPPEVILHVDHIIPVSEGGLDDISNLITSCKDCNLGKSNTSLENKPCRDDIQQLREETAEKVIQLKEYYKFQEERQKQIHKDLDEINEYWTKLQNGEYSLSNKGLMSIKYFLRIFTKYDIMEAMDTACLRSQWGALKESLNICVKSFTIGEKMERINNHG